MSACRLLPHGAYSLVPSVLTAMAWIASLFQDGCDYSKLSGTAVSSIARNPQVPWLEVGFAAYREPVLNTQSGNWEAVMSGICFTYPQGTEMDLYWTTAKAFDFFAIVLGGGSTFFLWFSACCVFTRGTWRFAAYQVLLAGFCQGMAFIWFNTSLCTSSGNSCTLFWGSKADIVALVFYLVSALAMLGHYPVPKENRDGDGVWLQEGTPPAPVQDGSLSLSPTAASTAPVTNIPSGECEDDNRASFVEMSTGQSSRQEERRDYNKKMSDVDIT